MINKFFKFLCTGLLCAAIVCSQIPFVFAEESSAETGNWDTYSDTWALTDALGRTAADASTAGGVRGNKKVGMFYFVWHNELMEIASSVDADAPRNITQIIENNEDWLTNAGLWGPESTMHYWGEPLYGYYNLLYDDYVVRAHATQLYDAGVDYIVFDMTNFYGSGYYNESADNWTTIKNICDVYLQMLNEGNNVPKITMLTTWNPVSNGQAITYIYEKIYSNPEYSDLWFRLDGKPLILGNPDYISDPEIRDFFSYRTVNSAYTNSTDSWQWLATYPQGIGASESSVKEIMAVGVAQNWTDDLAFMSMVDDYGRFIARGRSWTSTNHKMLTDPTSEEYKSEYGFNFQEQFNRALNLDPDMLLVTGWNEWIAARFLQNLGWAGTGNDLPNMANFADGFTTEFSRDIEMTREGNLGDNFYNQLAENIRLFKGVRSTPSYRQEASISVDGDFGDWDNVTAYFRDTLNDQANRDAQGMGSNYYVNKTGRNDFKQIKVARDDENLYFYVETTNTISDPVSNFWMTSFFNTGSDKNWEGYDYALSRSGTTATEMVLERSTGGYNWERIKTIPYKVNGNKLEFAIAFADLGLDASNPEFQFKFFDMLETSDSSQLTVPFVEGDLLEFYLSGDAAPNARFNYQYKEYSVSDSTPGYVNMYDENASRDAVTIGDGESAAVRFTAEHDFVGVDLMPYAVFSTPASFHLALYQYDSTKNYADNIAAGPIYERTAENVYDRTALYLGAKRFPAGDYLFVISDIQCENPENILGLYYHEVPEGETSDTTTYLNGLRISGTELELRIYYSAYAKAGGTASIGTTETVIDLGETKTIAGVALTPQLEGGMPVDYPTAFEILVSNDGTNYTAVPKQAYDKVGAALAEQYYEFNYHTNARYVKIQYLGNETANLAAADALVYADTDAANGMTGSGCSGMLHGGVWAAIGGVALIVAAVVILIQKGDKKNV